MSIRTNTQGPVHCRYYDPEVQSSVERHSNVDVIWCHQHHDVSMLQTNVLQSNGALDGSFYQRYITFSVTSRPINL